MADLAFPAAFWRAAEALHAVVYFTPEARPTYEALGLRGFWMGYFASRSAALGPASPQLVTGLFFGFAPTMVARALPDAWARTTPAAVLAAREELAVRTLTPLLPPGPVVHIAEQLDAFVPNLNLAGHPLAAAQLTVTGAATPVARLWRAVTVLREYRGDGHVAALVAAGLDGAEANLVHAATGALPLDQRANRGWTEDEWGAAHRRLRRRGWLAQSGDLTPAGRSGREAIEAATDASVARVGDGMPNAAVRRLTLDLVRVSAGPVKHCVPYPNAMGVLRP